MMLSSAISNAVKSARKMKKVADTDPGPIFEAAMPTGIRSWMAHGLASDLGQHPAGLRSEVGQRDRPYGDPQQPALVRQFILAVEPPDDAQQQDEEAPGTDHHTERVEEQRYVGDDLLRGVEVAVPEIGEIFAQELLAFGLRGVELGGDLSITAWSPASSAAR